MNNQIKTVAWKLDENEANFILNVLVERPFKEVNALVNKLAMQMAPMHVPEAPPTEPQPMKAVDANKKQA